MIGVPSTSRNNDSTTSTIMNTKEKEKYIEEYDFPYCDEATKYEKVAKIGQGTFGFILHWTSFTKLLIIKIQNSQSQEKLLTE